VSAHVPVSRSVARLLVGLGSLAFVVGGVLIFNGASRLGDGFMIGGGIALLVGALILTTKPTGDHDVG
jgi:hypothetical protein